MNKKILSAAILVSLGTVAPLGAQAASLNNGDVLTIATGVPVFGASSTVTGFTGSYYGVDTNADKKISNTEKVALSQGTTGLVIGVTTTPGAFHLGAPAISDTNAITAPDLFFGNTGSWYTTVPITGGTTGLNMSGWNWAWASSSSIPMGGGAWQPANCSELGCTGYTFTNGIGRFQWDGVYGDAYTLDYTSTVPAGDPSSLGGIQFYTHLVGTVTAVPVPGAAWLFGSGLLGLLGAVKKRKTACSVSIANRNGG